MMMRIVLLVAAVVLLNGCAVLSSPTPPGMPSDFSSTVTFTLIQPNVTAEFYTRIAQSSTIPAFVWFYYDTAQHTTLIRTDLSRGDLMKEYIADVTTESCNIRDITGKPGSLFGWVPFSTFGGNIDINGRKCDVWELTQSALTLYTLQGTSYPVRETIVSTERTIQFDFADFAPQIPDPALFTKPTLCN
eukprot:ANDGO_00960.mRNA.1 hypothetical protein